MKDCLFCRVGAKEISVPVLYEDEDVFVFLDQTPIAPGHTLVIPKGHVQNILELPDDKVAAVFLAVKKITARLGEVLNTDGFTIGINHGKVGGQAVDHLHVHIIPRFEGDGGKSIHSVVNNPPKDGLEEMAEKIRF